jgi:hypothetical protein
MMDGAMTLSLHGRRVRELTALLGVAIAVSVVHYADNVGNYDDYPSGGSLPAPSAGLILASWFLFTAAGIAGYVLYRRGRFHLAPVLLAVYAGSGLVGLGHYTVPGALDMPWWRQAHVLADIVCGVLVLAFALRAVRERRAAYAA